MTLHETLRGFRATTTLACVLALAITPAADAATHPSAAKSHKAVAAKKQSAKQKAATKRHRAAQLREAQGKKPSGSVQAVGQGQSVGAGTTAPDANGLGNADALSAKTQLLAMNVAIQATPSFYAGRETGCKSVTPVLAAQPGQIMAGNFRDADGFCYVWLNLTQSSLLTGSEICKTTLHEMGHLTGLAHSPDPMDVMYSPFRADPIPTVCQPAPAAAKAG